VRNSDFFLHLATGRELASGNYTFGEDPFAYTTRDVYWANHAWLFDLLLYTAYQLIGGAGLVVLKALAIAALALVLLRFRPSGGPLWVPGVCALLALLTMRPRLLLQPACLSIVLLGLVLWLLWRRGRGVYVLPWVFVLWVNLDGWFVLGLFLLLVVCVADWIGLVGPASRAGPEEVPLGSRHLPRLPWWLLPACLAACLVSPHHVFAFRLPDELSWRIWTGELRHDPRFAGLFASPWQLAPLGPASGYNLSAWAYFILLGLGALSFVGNRSARRDWRLPVWLLFALLGAWPIRLAGFFAVVAGPITALNFGELLPAGAGPRLARLGVVLVALVLLVLTWPGWLTGLGRSETGLAWRVRPDPSLERLCRTVTRWREEGLLREEQRLFAIHPDVAHYCAWFAPGEKNYLDSRLSLFLHVIGSFEQVCRGLDPSLGRGEPEGWQEVLDSNDVACVVLYDPDVRRLGTPLHQVNQSPANWPILAVAGRAVIVGNGSSTLRGAHLNVNQLAFAPPGDDSPLPPAPRDPAGRLLADRPCCARFTHPPSGSAWERDAAAVYLRLFEEDSSRAARQQDRRTRSRQVAGMVGVAALPGGPAPTATLLTSRLGLGPIFLPDRNNLPPALPLLAIRAARRAVAAHPDDARAWLLLGQAYLALARTSPSEMFAAPALLGMLRHVQTVTAFSQALLYEPDLIPAHEALALLYTQRNYLDLALKHRAAQLRLTRAAGPLPGEERSAFEERVDRLQELVDALQRDVQDRQNRFVIRTWALSDNPLARARVALDLGLAGKALDDVLLRSHALLLRVPGARLQLELLLMTGRVEQARQFLDDEEVRPSLDADPRDWYELRAGAGGWVYRLPAGDWFDACQAAAAGQYRRAGSMLARLREGLQSQRKGPGVSQLRTSLALFVATEVGATAQREALAVQVVASAYRTQSVGLWNSARFLGVEEADLYLVEALLEIERGGADEAAEHLRQADLLYAGAAGLPRPGRALANAYRVRMSEPR
jgi:hypothetical protein